MTINRLNSTSTILGLSLLAIVGTTQYAQAANLPPSGCTINTINGTNGLTLNVYSSPSNICAPPANWTPQLFAWEGRAGGPGDYTFALGDNGAQLNNNATQPQSTPRPWTNSDNAAALRWVVDYNPTTKLATFSVDSGIGQTSLNYTSTTATNSTPFNAFSLGAKVLGPDSKISAGTTAQIVIDRVTDVNGNFVPIGIAPFLGSALAGNSGGLPAFNELLFATGNGEEITKVEGRLALSWTGVNPYTTSARGRVGFIFKAFDPATETTVESQAAPEPFTILGTLTALGLGAGVKRKLARKKQ